MEKKTTRLIKSLLILLIIMTSSIVSECASNTNLAPSAEESGQIFTLPSTGNTMKISVQAGKTFTIKVRGNPTTGYGWYLDNPSGLDSSLIAPVNLNDRNSGEYTTDPHPEGMVGVGGSYYFTFKANQKASGVVLRFVNKRPWEPEPWKVVDVTVDII